MRHHIKASVLALLVFAIMLTSGLSVLQPAAASTVAPLAGPTPVTVTRPSASAPKTFQFWSNSALITSTTASCVDVGSYAVIDAQYYIDQTAVNTVTLTTQWSVDGSLITDGVDLVTNNAADSGDMQQAQVFGRYLCPRAIATNTNPVTVTLFVIAK